MVNLHDLYLNTIAAVLESRKLDAVQQPEGEKPAGVIWAMLKGTTKPDAIITYSFEPQTVRFTVVSRDMGRTVARTVSYVEGIEPFLEDLVKFISAGRIASKS